MSKCNCKCIYFPNETYGEQEYYLDENGTKRSTNMKICDYDNRPIKSWNKCHRGEPKLKK